MRAGMRAGEVALMLYWAFLFLIVALVAGALGMGGVAGTAAGIARVLFGVFIVLFLVGLVLGLRVFS
jgi:uncharacterized membrane protein YtjA (UPF0391 family)